MIESPTKLTTLVARGGVLQNGLSGNMGTCAQEHLGINYIVPEPDQVAFMMLRREQEPGEPTACKHHLYSVVFN